jgi:hypothetical protein
MTFDLSEYIKKSTSDLQEKVKHDLSCLPEVKQEIRYYLELIRAGNHFSKLQDILSELEEFPDIQELLKRGDITELLPFFSKLVRAKTDARIEILTLRTNLELGLDRWWIGWHPVKESSVREQMVDHIWAVNIQHFGLPARIVVLHLPSDYRVAFGVCTQHDNVSSSIAQIKLPESWIDPLDAILCQLDIFHGTNTVPEDGIGYDFYNLSWASESHIHFYDPVDTQFVELEKAFFSVAETVVNKAGQQAEKEYLMMWKKWLKT